MIRIFPSKLEGEPIERHRVKSKTTINQWLSDNVASYEWRESPPISVQVNGKLISPTNWHSCEIKKKDQVNIYPEPKGIETIVIATVAAVAAFAAVVTLLQPSIPKQKGGRQGSGDNLNEASLKGNKVKINDPIRESFGTRKIYPDYLVPNHRYFEEPRKQIVETHLSIGIGEFDIPASRLSVGDTPLISLGADASYAIYQPGQSVVSDPRCKWWHSAPEVSVTSTGTAGLELKFATTATERPTSSQYIFSGNSVTIPDGAGSFPADWEPGFIVRIDARYQYTVTDVAGAGARDIISGGDADNLGLVSGDTIEISGDNAGFYIVNSITSSPAQLTLNYSNGDPATSLVSGTRSMSIGFRGLRFRILSVTSNQIILDRLNSTGGTDEDWPGYSDITLGDAVIQLDPSSREVDLVGPFAACPEGELTTEIEWDVFFPGGLVGLEPSGGKYEIGASHTLEYRDIETAGAWTAITKVHYGSSLDAQGFTNRATLPYPMRPECRMRKVFFLTGGRLPEEYRDDTQWYGLKSLLSAPSSYPGVTTLAVKIAGGGRIAAQSEQLISAIGTRKLPTRSGGAWTAPVATRDIAPAVAYIGKSLGYQDEDLDLAELDRLDAIWKARGDTFDQSFESLTTAKDAINVALKAGFSEMTIDRGRIRPVRDELRTVFEQMYTPQNCTEILTRDFQAITPDDFDGVDVEYTNGSSWQVETVECRLPGDAGTRVQKIQVEGVTSRTRAWRIGMRARLAQKYRRYSYSTATELDALNSRYLSYVALAGDVPGYGKSALLLGGVFSGPSVILQSSEPFEWTTGASHVVGIRKPDGTLSGPYAATRIDDYRLSIPSIDFVPDTSWDIEPPHLLFGTTETWTFPALITDISPRGSTGVSLTAVNYAPEVYQYDDSSPPS